MTDFRERIILALDFGSPEEAYACLDRLTGDVKYVKVGMELFYAAGPAIVSTLKERGFKVFVDLKIHDIPNTAQGAMRSLARLGADMMNVHAAGGVKMMAAAREGVEQGTPAGSPRPLLIGVTMLTSTSEDVMNSQLLIPGKLEDTVAGYAAFTKEAGLDGVVASPLEVPLIKKTCGTSFVTVTPGIRPAGAAKGDQTRVTTPEEALLTLKSDYIVIGRAITGAADPHAAWNDMIDSLKASR
ncbi:orotidine-5'-phosphate decarboxylase [Brevibacillus fluminis]|uniref:orotidine-5'-phosphate decarboxylase n=1 Tax=Brevibacillus fluminis TaxID=511487 RepID=UPI003F8C8016